jgi:hypothetical protein
MTLSLITNLPSWLVPRRFSGAPAPGMAQAGGASFAHFVDVSGIGRRFAALILVTLAVAPQTARAISCTTQSQIAPGDRAELAAAVTRLTGFAIAGDTASLRAATLPAVAAQFDGIAATVEGLAPALKGAAASIENLYLLHAEDLKPGDDEADFFCSVPGSQLLVTIAIPQLPAGTYALALVHANGVAKPEQIGEILARSGGKPSQLTTNGPAQTGPPAVPPSWQLAGFFARPLTIAGHDGVWYWSRARELGKAQQRWSAYFYYQSAEFLLTPVDFLSSPNLAKLQREAAAVRPDGLPGSEGVATMTLAAGDQSFAITSLRTDGALGGLDLVIHYNANAANVDPVYQRGQALALMQAILKQHPELRTNFHGLWVYADSAGHQSFAVELPMDQIPVTPTA